MHAKSTVAALVLVCACPWLLGAVLPADSGAVNVRDHGAKGDGKADDTAAILAAIAAARTDQGKFFWPSRVVYFPAGTYRVTDSLMKRDENGRYLASMALVGESADTVRIRLDEATAGFTDAKAPKPVIYTTSMLLGGASGAGGKDYTGKGEGNDAYGNYVEDLTIDIGPGNPGAVGIDFLANNSGAIRHVRIMAAAGSGRTGISMERKWPGPLLLSDVKVQGFAVGISVSQREYGLTMEGVALSGQSEVALRNNGNALALRNVRIETGALALQNMGPDGLVVSDQLVVQLARNDATWVDNRGYLTMKGTRVTLVSGESVAEKAGGSLQSATDGAYFGNLRLAKFDAFWKLATPPTPAAWTPEAKRWASVERFGAKADSGEDATEAIRAAMQSGAEVVYLPSGRYVISDVIDVPAKVRRIVGMYSSVTVSRRRAPTLKGETGMFRVATAGSPLTIERIALDNIGMPSQLGIEHSGARSLVLQDVLAAGTGLVSRMPSGGPLFLENTCCGPMVLAGRNGVWARQFNTEGQGVRIFNDGAPLSILGFKTEQNNTAIQNTAGANTEVIGGLLYMIHPPAVARPAFINASGARFYAVYVETVQREGASYRVHVSPSDDGTESAKQLSSAVMAEDLPTRGRGRVVPGLEVGLPANSK
ncbi:hypothetical protein RD110_10095 [Rhodoferax koreense]|uniref:Rhamnogalacturonase A/B/Epimerase-like pectate lyase domain-containing protein n=1 Tax=Rhodoferax koreensis TaxID=1842727 RepID=A0A1P8JUT9_9BURK|nr:hypothetical protein RD110_10095 [Rhodoferax koreense]